MAIHVSVFPFPLSSHAISSLAVARHLQIERWRCEMYAMYADYGEEVWQWILDRAKRGFDIGALCQFAASGRIDPHALPETESGRQRRYNRLKAELSAIRQRLENYHPMGLADVWHTLFASKGKTTPSKTKHVSYGPLRR